MQFLRTIPILAISALLAACAVQKYAPDTAPEYVIIKDYTPFYRLGPMQGRGPDATLKVNDRVKLLSREMGYSLVQLEDGEDKSGYIENDAMAPAPPRPPISASGNTDSDSAQKKNGKHGSGAAYHGKPLNDTPLPDPKVPPPDLNIAPEEVPNPTPAPSPPPEKPKFRT
ncbi:hypothetical protein BH09VER1_BH09VER1_18920 [soil metagenome]